jgi:hypothetical protein
MYALPRKMSSTSGCISTGDLTGANTFLQNRNNYELPSSKCTGY